MYAIQSKALGGGWLTLQGHDHYPRLITARLRAHAKRRLGRTIRVVDLTTERVVWPESLEGEPMRPDLLTPT